MPRYIFILHDGDEVIERVEYDMPSDSHALEVAIASSKTCEVDLWTTGDRLVAVVANGCAQLTAS